MPQIELLEKIEGLKYDGNFSIKADKPSYREIKDDHGRVIDYQDVRIEGYANTFNLDRGGDQVIPGAFVEKLQEFLSNPILLVDHVRDTDFAAGVVKTAYEDSTGLKVTAVLSNAPGDKMRDIRFKVVEGVLRTFSIGGRFFGKMVNVTPEDSRFMINKIELREISIVTVPMNKESLFEVKEDSEAACSCGEDHGKTDPLLFELAEDDALIFVDDNGNKTKIIPQEGNQ